MRRGFCRAEEEADLGAITSHAQPSEVNAEQGEAIVEGSDGVALSLTPNAAGETGRRMLRAATRGGSEALGPKVGGQTRRRGLPVQLIHPALRRRLVGPPAQELGAVPETARR